MVTESTVQLLIQQDINITSNTGTVIKAGDELGRSKILFFNSDSDWSINLTHFLELKCETSEENRENIQWIFNGRYVFDGDFDKDFKIDRNILKIKNIQLYHTGQYECSGMDITCT